MYIDGFGTCCDFRLQVWPGVTRLRDFKQTFPRWRNTDFAQVRAAAGARQRGQLF